MKRRRFDVHGSLRASFKDGIFAAIMLGVTEHYAIPFALFMAATVQQVGWISAVPNLLGSIFQLFAVPLIRCLGGRLKFLVRAVIAQAETMLDRWREDDIIRMPGTAHLAVATKPTNTGFDAA